MFPKKPTGVAFAPIAALAAALALGGCVSIGGKAPEQLLSLDATQKVAPGAARATSGSALIVSDPEAPRMLDTVRVPVQMTPTSVAYVTDVQWADTPRHLFQRLLVETLSASSDRLVLDSGYHAKAQASRLGGELIAFNLDEASNSAVVTFDAVLVQGDGTLTAKQRFTASAPVGGKITAASVGAPLNAAANKVAADIAAWLATQPR